MTTHTTNLKTDAAKLMAITLGQLISPISEMPRNLAMENRQSVADGCVELIHKVLKIWENAQ